MLRGLGGYRLDVRGGDSADGTRLQIWNYSGTPAQVICWDIESGTTFHVLVRDDGTWAVWDGKGRAEGEPEALACLVQEGKPVTKASGGM